MPAALFRCESSSAFNAGMMYSGRRGIVGKGFVFSPAGSLKGIVTGGVGSKCSGIWAGECDRAGQSRRTQANDAWKRGRSSYSFWRKERKAGASASESLRAYVAVVNSGSSQKSKIYWGNEERRLLYLLVTPASISIQRKVCVCSSLVRSENPANETTNLYKKRYETIKPTIWATRVNGMDLRRMSLGNVPHRTLYLLPLVRAQKERPRQRDVQFASYARVRVRVRAAPEHMNVHARPRVRITLLPRKVHCALDEASKRRPPRSACKCLRSIVHQCVVF